MLLKPVIKLVICLVILIFVSCKSVSSGNKIKRNVWFKNVWNRYLDAKNNRTIERGRGLLGGLVSISKVLNFFPVGGERECQPEGYSIAKAGLCLNPYDCRQREGRPSGDCAQGLGVCCVFEVSCGGVVQNNLTYFMSPGFPELWGGDRDCNITIEKTYAGIMQLKIDFLHFSIGQPNRTTGECNEDAMILGDGQSKLSLCGQNHNQHIYYTLSSATETREAGGLPDSKITNLAMVMRSGDMPRLWLMRIAQMPLAMSAPHGCLQYFTANNGTIKTFNYATNGRHLASQDYKACIRRNAGYCSVRYVPCDQRSFRIESGNNSPPATGSAGMQGQNQMIANNVTQEDEIEGSGEDPQVNVQATSKQPGLMTTDRAVGWSRWSPYAQHYIADDDKIRYLGYGTYGAGLPGHGRLRCRDRVTIPCENEYFVSSSYYEAGVCDPHHCGGSFCPGQQHQTCWVETSITPFAVSVHFGPPIVKSNPEDNIGMCLRYTQLPCDT